MIDCVICDSAIARRMKRNYKLACGNGAMGGRARNGVGAVSRLSRGESNFGQV